jgi:hypothetical protein
MAISLEVPITAYTRGGTALVSSHKRTRTVQSEEHQKRITTTNPFSPKQVGVDRRNIKRETKEKCNFTYKDHTVDQVLPDLHIQCSRKDESNKTSQNLCTHISMCNLTIAYHPKNVTCGMLRLARVRPAMMSLRKDFRL